MDITTKALLFKKIFQHYLKINARSMSVRTLLSERNLRRINFSPYYQRNYVWDNSKQTFFIESVILGTEIPPLILFKTGQTIEVIDGRQRFETLKRFKENDFGLNINGLKELQILKKLSFNKLSPQQQELFLDSNIRIFEFEVVNQPNLSEDIIDQVKKEIFRRYNTGITPLTKEELDNAKYDTDEFSELFKKKLKEDSIFFNSFNECFFPKEVSFNNSKEDLIAKNVDFIRRYRILNNFPISTYARGTDRTEIIDLLYDFAQNNSDNPQADFKEFCNIIHEVLYIYKVLSKRNISNKLIYECILWAVSILHKEGIYFELDTDKYFAHYSKNISKYSEDSSHYYSNIKIRYSDTADFFLNLYNVNFSVYIKNDDFKNNLDELKQTEVDAANSLNELANLRIHKPNPIATPIDEIRNDLKSSRYLLRPSYQRQEKITVTKASSIIESILLGINLPPIFIFKRNSTNTKEVVDGQQRLLAILGFLGVQYVNENGQLTYSNNNNFKLKGLKILNDIEGKSFSNLSPIQQDKILDFVIDLIIIEEDVNRSFDPVDLFIRLNYKPYPIINNSFEMWNSIVNHEVIKKIKELTYNPLNNWFFLRERLSNRPDRMLNEELITILSYICYTNKEKDSVIGFFPRQDRITCRLINKKSMGDFLISLENKAHDKVLFLGAISRTEQIINLISKFFDDIPTKDSLNEFLNVKQSQTFRRSLQDFYVLWLVLDNISHELFEKEKDNIKKDISSILAKLKNADNEIVNENYLEEFMTKLENIKNKYSK